MFTGPEEEVAQARARWLGQAPGGSVTLNDFVEGIILTLGGKLGNLDSNPNNKFYFVEVPGIDLMPLGCPGVPISQSYPEDVFNDLQIPTMFIRFDNFDAALERQHPGMVIERLEDPTADEIPNSGGRRKRIIERQQDVQYDLNFTLVAEARNRELAGLLLTHVLLVCQPHSAVFVKDSVGDFRSYYMSTTSGAPEDEIFEVADMSFGFSFPIRIMGELGQQPSFTQDRVGSENPTITLGTK